MERWVRSDLASGSVYYLTETPQVHLHYLMTDAEADAAGWSRVEMCCHGCGAAVVLTFAWPQRKDALRPERDRFQDAHRACPDLSGGVLCPLDRTSMVHVDLRRPAPGATEDG
jgi:hypothetical protein